MKVMRNWKLLIQLILAGFWLAFSSCSRVTEPAGVLVIGIDGLSVEGFQRAHTPVLDSLARSGILSLNTSSVHPSISGPAWASHFYGTGPEVHGITTNRQGYDEVPVPEDCKEGSTGFPTLWNLVKSGYPDRKTALFYDWDGLLKLYPASVIDTAALITGSPEIASTAAEWIRKNRPVLAFVYFGEPDETGHTYGWDSRQYISEIEAVDKAIGRMMAKISDPASEEKYVVMVISDHGGKGYSHGGESPEEMTVPWMVSGPGIPANVMMGKPNSIVNSAPEIARILNLEVPSCWTGIAPDFTDKEIIRPVDAEEPLYVPAAFPVQSQGVYFQSQAIDFECSDPEAVVRYTLDGSEPEPRSPSIHQPLLVTKSAVVRYAAFRGPYKSKADSFVFILGRRINVLYPESNREQRLDDVFYRGFRGSLPDSDSLAIYDSTALIAGLSELSDVQAVRLWLFPPSGREFSVDHLNVSVWGAVSPDSFKKLGEGTIDLTRREITDLTGWHKSITPGRVKWVKLVFNGAQAGQDKVPLAWLRHIAVE
ncbi:MAG: hypothetical protein Kow00127_10550 [Bacteroidales bacterium]